MSNRYSKYGSNLSFIDMLFALLIGVFSIFIIATLLLGEQKAGKKVDEHAQLMISMTWDDQSADDMDLWLLDPNHEKIYYHNKENSFISLDRDDLGVENDFVVVDGVRKEIRHNEEIIRIRVMEPGHYVVNVMFYARKMDPETGKTSVGPQNVKVTMLQVNPAYKVLYTRTVEMKDANTQETAFSFDITGTPDMQTLSQETYQAVGATSGTLGAAMPQADTAPSMPSAGPPKVENFSTERVPFIQLSDDAPEPAGDEP